MAKKHMLCFTLVGVLVSLLLPGVTLAARPMVFVEAPSEVESGADFDAKVSISSVVDFDSGNFDLTYDPDVLEVADVSDGQIGGTVIPVVQWLREPDGIPGRVRVVNNVPGVPGVSGAGYLAQIRFDVVGSPGDTSRLVLSDGIMFDNVGGAIQVSWSSTSVTVAGGETTGPRISCEPQTLSFSAVQGGDEPPSKTVEVWNSGIETLEWSASAGVDWLSLEPAEGSSTGERDSIAVSVDISGMEPDTYTASITLSAPGVAGSPGTVHVVLTVQSEEGAEQPPDEEAPPDGEEGEGPAEETAPPGEEEPEDAAPGGPGAAPSGQFPWYLVAIGVLGAVAVGLLVMMLVRRRRY